MQVVIFSFMVRTCSQCQHALLNMFPLLGLNPRGKLIFLAPTVISWRGETDGFIPEYS